MVGDDALGPDQLARSHIGGQRQLQTVHAVGVGAQPATVVGLAFRFEGVGVRSICAVERQLLLVRRRVVDEDVDACWFARVALDWHVALEVVTIDLPGRRHVVVEMSVAHAHVAAAVGVDASPPVLT